MAKFLDQSGSKCLVDKLKTVNSALNTKINGEILARENLSTDVTNSIAALDTKLDGIDAGAQVNSIEEFWVDGVKQTVTDKKISLDLSGKVDKVSGKQLSTEDFTTAEKTKLAGIENGAEANIIGSIKVDGTALTVTNKAVNINLSGKVDTVSGKQLSTNDFTTAEKNKLAAIESGAQVNVIEEIFIDGTKQTVTDKKTSLDLSNYAKKSDVAGVYKYKGSVNTFSALPTTAETGDVYNVKNAGGTDVFGTSIKAGDNVAFNGTGWDVLAGTVDLSGYVEKVSGKQLSTEDYTTSEKTKLAGIATNANNYTLPTATASTLGGVKIGSGISVSSGTISVPTVTSSANGLMSSSDKKKLDNLASITTAGANITISGGTIKAADTTYSVATTSTNGLMSSADKAKLDGLSTYTAGDNITISGGKISGTANTTYSAATTTTSGLMSADDKKKLNNLASITAAGDNITISGGKISGTANTTYSAGSNITISGGKISGTANTTYSAATTTTSGLMSADDKKKLNNLASITTAGDNITISGGKISGTAPYTLPAATASTLGGVKIGTGLSVNNGTVSLATATASSLGGIKVGTGLTNTNGTVSLVAATAVNLGGVKVGSGISVSSGIISVPKATTSQAGIVKVGNGLSMDGDTLNVTVSGVDDLDTWNAANLYLKPAILGSTSSTVNGAIWFVSDSGTSSGSSNVVVLGTTASALDGAVWFA